MYASGRSLFTFTMNALFLQGFAAPTFGSNSDDWRETFRPDIPSPARMYNYFLGGKDNFAADRETAEQIMQSLVGEFDPSELESQYRSDLRQLLEAKLDGQEIARPEPVADAPVVDLMEALKRSVAEAKGRKTTKASTPKKKTAAKNGTSARTPARKSA